MYLCSVLSILISICWMLSGNAQDTPKEIVLVQDPILKSIDTVSVAAEAAGVLVDLPVHEGDEVDAGKIIARLRSNSAEIELGNAQIDLEEAQERSKDDISLRLAEKASAVAETEYYRAIRANEKVQNTYPQSEVDRYRLLWETSKLEVERAILDRTLAMLKEKRARNDVQKKQEILDRHQITAPMHGIVVSVKKHTGEWVEPGESLVQIIDTERLRIEGFIPARRAAASLKGCKANVVIKVSKDDSETLTGRVVFVSPEVNPVNLTNRIFIEVENTDGRFGPGFEVTASVVSGEP